MRELASHFGLYYDCRPQVFDNNNKLVILLGGYFYYEKSYGIVNGSIS